MEVAREKEPSIWHMLTHPLSFHGFVLHKEAFQDVLCLCYGQKLVRLPPHCVCGNSCQLNKLSTESQGFFHSGTVIIRDVTAHFLTEVCNNVLAEFPLQNCLESHWHMHQLIARIRPMWM